MVADQPLCATHAGCYPPESISLRTNETLARIANFCGITLAAMARNGKI
jgi:hypothetical protein